jgi:5-methylcytosine-specific restriction protein A
VIAPPQPDLGKRSPHWEAVRAAFLAGKTCAACGRSDQLQAHHKKPFHLHPELELDPGNLIPLCEGTRNCHYVCGHAYHWHGYNPAVDVDADVFLELLAKHLGIADPGNADYDLVRAGRDTGRRRR